MKKHSNLIINKDIELVKGSYSEEFIITENYLYKNLDNNMSFEKIINHISNNSNRSKFFKEYLNLIISVNDFDIEYIDSEYELSYDEIIKKIDIINIDNDSVNRVIYRGFNYYKKIYEYLVLRLDKEKMNYLKKSIIDNKYKENLLSVKNYCDYLMLNYLADEKSFSINKLNIAILNIVPGSVIFTIVRANRLYSLKEFNINFTKAYNKNIDTLEGTIEDINFDKSFNLLKQYLNLEMKLFESDNNDSINLIVLYGNITDTPGFKTALSKSTSTKVINIRELNNDIYNIIQNYNISMTSLGAILYG